MHHRALEAHSQCARMLPVVRLQATNDAEQAPVSAPEVQQPKDMDGATYQVT